MMISSLKEIITELNQNQVVGVAPDGPKGPREKIKDGLISLIKKTDALIIPLSYSAKIKIKLCQIEIMWAKDFKEMIA